MIIKNKKWFVFLPGVHISLQNKKMKLISTPNLFTGTTGTEVFDLSLESKSKPLKLQIRPLRYLVCRVLLVTCCNNDKQQYSNYSVIHSMFSILSNTWTSAVPAIKLWLNEESTHYSYTMSWCFKIHLSQLLSPASHNSFGQAFPISRTDLCLITLNAKIDFSAWFMQHSDT